MMSRGDQLHERFDRLRRIVESWEMQISEAPKLAMDLFDKNDAEEIGELIKKTRFLRERIRDVKKFIRKWDNLGKDSMEVTNIDDE
jgi:hypothetical protein